METALYILGFLIRYGSMHGYRLKQIIDDNVADFTDIKTSNLYYHLGKMTDKGFITGEKESGTDKPDKTVFTVTDAGCQEFKRLLYRSLNKRISFSFDMDNALFFNEFLTPEDYQVSVEKKIRELSQMLEVIVAHKDVVLQHVPAPYTKYAELIFLHHMTHFEAELKWLEKVKENK